MFETILSFALENTTMVVLEQISFKCDIYLT